MVILPCPHVEWIRNASFLDGFGIYDSGSGGVSFIHLLIFLPLSIILQYAYMVRA